MEKILLEKFSRVINNKEKLESMLGIKIKNRGKEIFIYGNPENEYIAEKIFLALEFGFPFSVALLIKEDDYLFEIINLKDYTKKRELKVIRGRIIGEGGKTLSTLGELTKCYFEIKDNKIGIIGDPEHIKNAHDAIIYLIQGSKHANVYSYLEKHQIEPVFDLGLKKFKKKRQISF